MKLRTNGQSKGTLSQYAPKVHHSIDGKERSQVSRDSQSGSPGALNGSEPVHEWGIDTIPTHGLAQEVVKIRLSSQLFEFGAKVRQAVCVILELDDQGHPESIGKVIQDLLEDLGSETLDELEPLLEKFHWGVLSHAQKRFHFFTNNNNTTNGKDN